MTKLFLILPFLLAGCTPMKFHADGTISGGVGIEAKKIETPQEIIPQPSNAKKK